MGRRNLDGRSGSLPSHPVPWSMSITIAAACWVVGYRHQPADFARLAVGYVFGDHSLRRHLQPVVWDLTWCQPVRLGPLRQEQPEQRQCDADPCADERESKRLQQSAWRSVLAIAHFFLKAPRAFIAAKVALYRYFASGKSSTCFCASNLLRSAG